MCLRGSRVAVKTSKSRDKTKVKAKLSQHQIAFACYFVVHENENTSVIFIVLKSVYIKFLPRINMTLYGII